MVKIQITKLMYGWSKYGGGFKGLVKEELDEWACQCCGEMQTKDLPSYMIELWSREFIRICTKCKNKMVLLKIKNFQDLKEVCKPNAR